MLSEATRVIALYICTIDGCEPIMRDAGEGSISTAASRCGITAALTRAINSERSNGFAR